MVLLWSVMRSRRRARRSCSSAISSSPGLSSPKSGLILACSAIEVGISGIGFGLSAVGVAGTIHSETGDVENFLITFPQQRQQQRRPTSSWLIYRPENLLGDRESFVYEPRDVCFVIFDLPGEQLPPRGIQRVSLVKLLARIYACPDFVHYHLRPSLLPICPRSIPPTAPYVATLFSPISISSRDLQEDRGAILLQPSSAAGILKPSSVLLGVTSRICTWTAYIKVGRCSRKLGSVGPAEQPRRIENEEDRLR